MNAGCTTQMDIGAVHHTGDHNLANVLEEHAALVVVGNTQIERLFAKVKGKSLPVIQPMDVKKTCA